ncbi:MAG: hypothetical protein JXQ81_02755, partial [Desulfuromonadales bacterium]|nr:hypothetical protein [Desulfuromonadales bacterium]
VLVVSGIQMFPFEEIVSLAAVLNSLADPVAVGIKGEAADLAVGIDPDSGDLVLLVEVVSLDEVVRTVVFGFAAAVIVVGVTIENRTDSEF